MKNIKCPELLAPAGTLSCVRAAVAAGADAVYFGGQAFNARRGAANLSDEEVDEAVRLCRLHGVKTNLTVNTLIKQKELPVMEEYLERVLACQPDAVIVQDPAVARLIARKYPKTALHASTQMAVTNLDGVKLLEDLGYSRVVLARELSLEEIEEIRRHTCAELEVFVHGALCYSVSGRCLLSSFHGGRSGNRGACAQPCRLPYTIDAKKAYYLNLRDREGYSSLSRLVEIGVDCLKIEGRMKQEAYVAGTTAFYRGLLDQCAAGEDPQPSEEDLARIRQLFNRGGFTNGYFQRNSSMVEPSSGKNQGIQVGKIASVKGNLVTITSRQELHAGDELEVRTGERQIPLIRLSGDMITSRGTARFLVNQELSSSLHMSDPVFRIVDPVLNHQMDQQYAHLPKIPVSVFFTAGRGVPCEVVFSCRDHQVRVNGPVPEDSVNQPLSSQKACQQLTRLGDTVFEAKDFTAQIEEGLFVPVSALNELRRQACCRLLKSLCENETKPYRYRKIGYLEESENTEQFTESAGGKEQTPAHTYQIVCFTPRQAAALMETARLPEGKAFSEALYGHQVEIITDMTGCSAAAAGFSEETAAFAGYPLLSSWIRDHREDWAVRLPCTARGRDETWVIKRISMYMDLGCTRFEISYPGQIGWILHTAAEHGIRASVLSGPDMGLMNAEAVKILRHSCCEVCLSRECTVREADEVISALVCPPDGGTSVQMTDVPFYTVYGRVPYMMTAQCVYSQRYGCHPQAKGHQTILTDRTGENMPVFSFCPLCHSVIYSEKPAACSSEWFRKTRLSRYRIEYTSEDPETIRRTVLYYVGGKEEDPGRMDFPSVPGHFRKEVM